MSFFRITNPTEALCVYSLLVIGLAKLTVPAIRFIAGF